MAESLQLTLLGKPVVSYGDRPVEGFISTKSQALLVYLACTARPHSRDKLAGLLWGDMPDNTAKRNLTKALSNLRKLLDPYIIVERQSIAFNTTAAYQLDVEQFQTLVEAGLAQADVAALRQAVILYQGDFLEGLHVKEALFFEEWLLQQREHLRDLMLRILEALVIYHSDRAEDELGIGYANQLLGMEAWRETTHRHLMLMLTRSGRRNAALAQYETCRQILAEEFGVEPTPETTRLYQSLKAAADPAPHNLPLPAGAFIGREAELAQVQRLLNDPACRLITLTGPGGVGKTRLALQVAAQYLDRSLLMGGAGFADGIYFIPLSPPDDHQTETRLAPAQARPQLVAAIAASLGFTLQPGSNPEAQLRRHLQESPSQRLLILDSFEHLVEAAVFLDHLLQLNPALKLLVTSRERLNLTQEWVVEIEGLQYPGPDRVEEIEQYPAAALFLQHARQVQGSFVPSPADRVHLARICQLVGGLPLALELAASWLRLSTCAEIVAEIEQNLDFLAASFRNMPERHRSLRAVFDHSWQLLSPAEQLAFSRLAVFRGGFQARAAQVVAQASLLTLGSLVDKSLVHRTATGRYEIHDLLRQYAVEQLEARPVEAMETRERHAQYYAQFLRESNRHYKQHQDPASLAQIKAEADNIRLGWQQIIASERLEAEITDYWYLGSLEPPAGPEPVALRPPDPSWDQGLERHNRGFLAYQQGDFAQAEQALTESLTLLRAVGDDLYLARSKTVLGMLAYDRGQVETAGQFLQESLTDLQAVGEYWYRGYALAYLGDLIIQAGQPFPVEMERSLQESLLLSREVGDQRAVAHNLKNLAGMQWARAVTARARAELVDLLEESLALCRAVNEAWCTATVLEQLGLATTAQAALDMAATYFYEGLRLALAHELRPISLDLGVGLAELRLKQNDLPAATWLPLLFAIQNHPAGRVQTQTRVARLLSTFDPTLTAKTAAAGQGRGQGESLATLLKAVMA